jgi:ribosomal protein L40E
MENAFTKELNSRATCKNCKAEIPKQSLTCNQCGTKNTYPEFVAALIVGVLGVLAMYALYQF